MLVRLLAVVVLGLASPAYAQQLQLQSAQLEALYARINAEVNNNLQCNTVVIGADRQLKEAQARIKALEEKYEPAPPPPK